MAYYLGAVWPEREITLDCTETEDVLGDFMELQSAVSNLIVNALKYSDPKHPVAVHWFEDVDQKLILEVSDRGEGIAPEHLPRLTERFYRRQEPKSANGRDRTRSRYREARCSRASGGFTNRETRKGHSDWFCECRRYFCLICNLVRSLLPHLINSQFLVW